MTTQELLDQFYQFASEQVVHGDTELSLDELYRVWRARNPSDIELKESVQVVQEAWAEFEAGDKGRPARAALQDMCQELGLVIDE